MGNIQPKLELSKKPDQELDNYAQDKVNRIENNADFPSVQGMLPDLKTTLEEYITALDNIGSGKSETAKKNQLRSELQTLLTKAASYCALDADGDVAKFLTSGFDVRSQGSPVGTLPKPSSFKFTVSDNTGEAFASMEAFPKAKGFSFAWTADPLTNESVWTVIPYPKKDCAFVGVRKVPLA
jgi:hypothetical protein